MNPDKKCSFRDHVDSFFQDLPSAEQILIFTVLALALSGIVYAQQQRQIANETMCPGEFNIAPLETIIFSAEGKNYQVRHNGISLGPDTVNFSITDSNLNRIFGGNIRVPEDEDTPVGGVNFQNRGTKDQSLTGTLFTLRANHQNPCIEVISPAAK